MTDKSSHNEANRVMNKFYMFENFSHRETMDAIDGQYAAGETQILTTQSVWSFAQYSTFTIEQLYE